MRERARHTNNIFLKESQLRSLFLANWAGEIETSTAAYGFFFQSCTWRYFLGLPELQWWFVCEENIGQDTEPSEEMIPDGRVLAERMRPAKPFLQFRGGEVWDQRYLSLPGP